MVAAGLFGPPTLMVPDPAGGQSSTSSLSLAATPIGPERPASMLHGNTTRKLGGADVDHAQKGLQFAKAMLMAASHVLTPTGEPVRSGAKWGLGRGSVVQAHAWAPVGFASAGFVTYTAGGLHGVVPGVPCALYATCWWHGGCSESMHASTT